MSDTAGSQTHAPRSDAPSGSPGPEDRARRLIERQLAVLERLADEGLQIVQAIKRQAVRTEDDPPATPVVKGNVAAAYGRAARAVRLTVLLQSKLVQDLLTVDRLAADKAAQDKSEADKARPAQRAHRKNRIHHAIERVARAEHEDDEVVEQLVKEAGECLDKDDIYGDVLSRPMSELVADICQDLGLSPDWPRLAEEAWAQAEIASGRAGAPLAALTPQEPDARPLEPPAEPVNFRPRAASP